MNHIKISLSAFADRWPSPVVARESVGDFSGGVLTAKYLANLDCQGKGPEGRFRCGRKICYLVESLIRFLESRSEVVEDK